MVSFTKVSFIMKDLLGQIPAELLLQEQNAVIAKLKLIHKDFDKIHVDKIIKALLEIQYPTIEDVKDAIKHSMGADFEKLFEDEECKCEVPNVWKVVCFFEREIKYLLLFRISF